MAPEDGDRSEIAGLLDVPGICLYTLDESLNLLSGHAGRGSVPDDEILRAVRETITGAPVIGPAAGSRSDGEAVPLVRMVRIAGHGIGGATYLLTITRRRSEAAGGPAYGVVAQDVSAVVPEDSSRAGSAVDAVSQQEFRKFLHSLSNPLSIISGFAEILLSSIPEGTPNRDSAEEIFANALRLRKILEEASHTNAAKKKGGRDAGEAATNPNRRKRRPEKDLEVQG